MKFRSVAGVFLLLTVCLCARAQTNNGPHFLTLRAAIDSALLNNRALQIERINPEIAHMTLRASWGYYDPLFTTQVRSRNDSEPGVFDPDNPGLESGFDAETEAVGTTLFGFLPSGLTYTLSGAYTHSTGQRNFLNFDAYRVGGNIFLQQPLLKNFWIDLPRFTIRVNKRNLQISEAGVHFVAMNVLNQVQQAYYDLVFAWENLRVQNDLLTARQEFLTGIERQIELGTMTVLEQRVAASQVANVQTIVIGGSNLLALAANNLKTLMGTPGTNWTEELFVPVDRLTVMPETYDLATSWQRGLARRPDLQQSIKRGEIAQLNVKFRRNQLFPSLDLFGSYGRRGAASIVAFPPDEPKASFTDAWDQFENADAPSDMIGIMLSFPLTRTMDRANFKASKELKKQADLVIKQQEEQIMREISDAIFTARYNYDQVHAARRASEFAESALKAEEEKLQGGRSSIIFVLQLQADLAMARAAEIRAKQDYNKAISQLHFAEGTILDHQRLVFEFE